MPAHTARPSTVSLNVNGTYHGLTSTQVHALKSFDEDGVMRDWNPDAQTVRQLARRGWVLRSRGHFFLTPQGKTARSALDAYMARKADALLGGVAPLDVRESEAS